MNRSDFLKALLSMVGLGFLSDKLTTASGVDLATDSCLVLDINIKKRDEPL